jgi:radical SAM protein with 4Fe4S-binding SPASM domain
MNHPQAEVETVEPGQYAQFSAALHHQSIARRIPLNGVIEVTRRCPLQCCHCYNRLPMADREARRAELSYDEHCRILDEICANGCLWLLYTGGEIFARGDFLDIYTYAKRRGLLITLFTNGTLITSDIADYLAEWAPFRIEISLYGRTPETYEKITGDAGSFDRCVRAIRLLKERRLPVGVKTTAITLNRHEIWLMKGFVEQDLGLEFKFDGMMNPGIDRSSDPLAVRLSPEEIVSLDRLDPNRMAAWGEFSRHFCGTVQSKENRDLLYHCGAGINSFAIDPQGQLSLCVLTHAETYDLRAGSFRQGWQEFLYRVRRRKITRDSKCVACEIKAICGMCPANAELEEGDPESPVDFLCRVAHLRSQALGLPVPSHGDCDYCEQDMILEANL